MGKGERYKRLIFFSAGGKAVLQFLVVVCFDLLPVHIGV